MEKSRAIEDKFLYPPQLKQLISFIREEVLPNNSENQLVGGWVPTYGPKTEEQIHELYTIFSELHQKITYDQNYKVNFLECGSGLGMVGAVASVANFNVYNFEIQEKLHKKAQEYLQIIEEKKIVETNTIHCINGSYYTPDMFLQYKRIFFEQTKISHNIYNNSEEKLSGAMMFDLGKNSEIKERNFETVFSELEKLHEKAKVWDSLGLLDNSYVDIQVVYCFPSDPFFKYGFMDQMSFILRPNSFLVLNLGSKQVRDIISDQQINSHEFNVEKKLTSNNFLVLQKN